MWSDEVSTVGNTAIFRSGQRIMPKARQRRIRKVNKCSRAERTHESVTSFIVSPVQFICSALCDSVTPWTAACQK